MNEEQQQEVARTPSAEVFTLAMDEPLTLAEFIEQDNTGGFLWFYEPHKVWQLGFRNEYGDRAYNMGGEYLHMDENTLVYPVASVRADTAHIATLEAENAVLVKERDVLRKALSPFAETAPSFKEWRHKDYSFPLKEEWRKDKPVLVATWPNDEHTSHMRKIYVEDFDKAKAALEGK